MGKMRDDSELEEQAFLMFAKEEDNEHILKKYQQLRAQELIKILQLKVESVVEDIQAIIMKKKPFNKDVDYDKRRKEVIDELASNNRLVFFGENANKLGESTLKNFLKVCKEHLQLGHLKSFSLEIIAKIFRRWLFPGRQELISKHLRKCSSDFRLKQLTRKKKTMEKLKIQHEILLKKSQLMSIEEQIQQIEKEIIPVRKSKCKVQEEQSQQDEVTYPSTEPRSKSVNTPVYSIINSKDKTVINKKGKPKRDKPSSLSKDASKEWTGQEQKFFISLLSKTSLREQQALINLMQQQFGKNKKFNPNSIRLKKFTMFRACKARFLHAIKKKNLLSKADYEKLKTHFQSINLLRAYKFITFFMNRYYYIVFESQSDRVLREIIDQVYKQPTRIQSKPKINDQNPRNKVVILPSKNSRKQKIEESEYQPL